MAKAKQQLAGVLTFAVTNSLVSIEGKLVHQDSDSYVLDVKRPRSSKWERKVYPTTDVLQAYTNEEGLAVITLRGTYEETLEGDLTVLEGGFAQLTNEDGETYIFAPGTWTFTAEADAEEEAKPAKSKAKAKPAKKQVEEAEEEEDESDDSEEEEEEEVKPAKKAKAKKEAAKPAKKAKPAPVEEDDEDEEEEEEADEDEDDDWED